MLKNGKKSVYRKIKYGKTYNFNKSFNRVS